ncbi:MAG: hypothetical protein BM558_13875 [Roseobacter sp. MedPE-SW]|nr:MAG: hypothetical protein BM558_13875 [Roseobacter sp. MedPE-SW]
MKSKYSPIAAGRWAFGDRLMAKRGLSQRIKPKIRQQPEIVAVDFALIISKRIGREKRKAIFSRFC